MHVLASLGFDGESQHAELQTSQRHAQVESQQLGWPAVDPMLESGLIIAAAWRLMPPALSRVVLYVPA